MNQLLHKDLSFRPTEASDERLLSAIYASTRAEEMALVEGWSEKDIAVFLEQQFQAQHIYYHQQYEYPDFRIILFKGQPAGRLYLDRRPKECRIVDITLLPEFRGKGLGETILKDLLAESASLQKTVTIHVERYNKARHLYDRLGFKMKDDSHAIYLLMEWKQESPKIGRDGV